MAKRGPKPKLSEERILGVAADLILKHGLVGLSMSAIARELSTAVSGLYRYFDSLEAVYVALQLQAIGKYEEQFAQAREKIDADLASNQTIDLQTGALIRILTVLRTYLRMAESHPVEQALIDAFLSAPTPTLQDDFAARMNLELEKILQICESSLALASECKAISEGDHRQRTHMIWAGLHGLEHFRKRDRILPERLQVKTVEQAMMRSLLLGFGASEEALGTANIQLNQSLR